MRASGQPKGDAMPHFSATRFLTTGALLCAFAAMAAAETADAILTRMDQNAKGATSFSANFKEIEYTASLDETAHRDGVVRLKRVKTGVIGVKEDQKYALNSDAPKPSIKIVHFTGGDLEMYTPKANLLEVYKIGGKSKTLNQYLLLAFGLSGAEVRQNYTIKVVGEETVDSIKTTHLELVPKDKEALKYITKVETWVPEGQAYSIQIKVTKEGGRNYLEWLYQNAKLNPSLPDSAFDFKAPDGVKKNVLQ
jgi:outer membrane lipoprotein-sorting protein